MSEFANNNYSFESTLLPNGFLARYNILEKNAPESSLFRRVRHCLSEQNYNEASRLLRIDEAYTWEYPEDWELKSITNAAWRRLQMLPEQTQLQVRKALKRGDFGFAKRILKSV